VPIVDLLKNWFLREGRQLPWRGAPDPYAVWVSEVMLQQTQVAVVIPYFGRWMRRFPTIEALAAASEAEVIKEWEGLGYYSRARNLHSGARFVASRFGGALPSDEEQLKLVKGLGPYTRGAIRSFAFRKKCAAVDGNVVRVLSRLFMVEEDLSKVKNIKKIWALAESLLPDKEPWLLNEALIELGALVCGKKPRCGICPLSGHCKSFRNGKAERLPFKSKKNSYRQLHRAVAVITSSDSVLLRRAEEGEIMSGLHEFPYFELQQEGIAKERLQKKVQQELSLEVKYRKSLPQQSHSFTRFRVKLYPMQFFSAEKSEVSGYLWHPLERLNELAFSSGHRRVLCSLRRA